MLPLLELKNLTKFCCVAFVLSGNMEESEGTYGDLTAALFSGFPEVVNHEDLGVGEKFDDSFMSSGRNFGNGESLGTRVAPKSNEMVGLKDLKHPMIKNLGSIAERRAVKCGFNASKINTARFRSTSPMSSPHISSPYLTIPPGISPAALLDSPIMFPNSRVSSPCGVAQSLDDDIDYQKLSPLCSPIDFEFPAGFTKEASTTNDFTVNSPLDISVNNNTIPDSNHITSPVSQPDIAADQMPRCTDDTNGDDHKETYPPMGMGRTSEDGYNWRKYGQKQVKGSEYPRSYYKCTAPNCQVKKKVERSHDGQITEIIYKGAHNHAKPQPSRRSALGSAFSFNEISDMGEGSGSCVKIEGGSVWRNIQPGPKDLRGGLDWRADGLERTSSASVVTELSDPLTTIQGRSIGMLDSAENPEVLSTLASHNDDDDDGATQGSISIGDDADDDEPESKRIKNESSMMDSSMTSRGVREPRVVVQIESEIDILDDGYRWRKYGQKVVKGNPNPRSYYKCTSAGCSVRKHVERASHNLKAVITTYEGKHNHEVPAARNSSHINSTTSNLPPPAPNSHSTLTLPRNTHIPKSETQIHDITPRFDRKPEFNNDFLRHPGFNSIYQMKFPPLQTTMPFGSYAPFGNEARASSIIPDFPISLPISMNMPQAGNFSLPGFDFNNTMKGFPVPGLLRPKQEQNESMYDSRSTVADHANASSSSSSSPASLYLRMMGSHQP